jgi:hypothetical protein
VLAEVADSGPVSNGDPAAPVSLDVALANYAGETVLLEAVTVDGGGNECAAHLCPVRLLYVPGTQGTRSVSATGSQLVTDGTVLHDTTAGSHAFHLLPSVAVREQVVVVRRAAGANPLTIQTASGDTFADGSNSLTLTTAEDVAVLKFPGTGNTVIRLDGAAGGGGGGSSSVVTTQTLAVASTTINSPRTPADGDMWTAVVKQDATGGRAVVWGAGVLLGPLIDAATNSAASSMCVVQFVGVGGQWILAHVPVLEVPSV